MHFNFTIISYRKFFLPVNQLTMSKSRKNELNKEKTKQVFRCIVTGQNHAFKFIVSLTTSSNHSWRWACVKVKAAAVWRKLGRTAPTTLAADPGCGTSCPCVQSTSASRTLSRIRGGMLERRCCHVRWRQKRGTECRGRSSAFVRRRELSACCVRWRDVWRVSSSRCSESMK